MQTTSPTGMLRGGAFTTPLGTIVATASPRGLRSVGFELDALADVDQETSSPVLEAFARYLVAYFGREFDNLPDVPLDLPPGPNNEVWEVVRGIRVGRTLTYGEIAARVGRPHAARAIGAAVGRNPLLLVLPCHRVIAQSGSVSGYSGGVPRKAWLLKHEGVLLV